MSAELPAVLTETVVSTEAAAKLLSTTSRTIVRWIENGCPVVGTLVRLDGVFVGGRWKTSREATVRFVTACQQARRPSPLPVDLPSPAKQRKQSRDDLQALEKMGVKVRS